MEFGIKIFFFSFSAYLIPVLAKNNAGNRFSNFLNFFAIFFGIFLPGWEQTEFGTKIFFSRFWPISSRFGKKIMSGIGFLIFWIFLLFFSEFSCRVEYKRNSGLKFSSPFLFLPHQVLATDNAGKRLYNFLNFLTIFFGIFLPGSTLNGIRD